MIDNFSIVFYAFTIYMLTSVSVCGILLLRFMSWFTNFIVLPLRVEMTFLNLKHMYGLLLTFTLRSMHLAACSGLCSRDSNCYVLTFWPAQKCHSRWCTGRKWHILMAVMRGNRVGGNWQMKWDEDKKKISLYSHRLTHPKRVTSELHDSYFRSMTITQAIPKIAEVTHPDRPISEEIAEAWRSVHITAW